ncbi:MAG: hypothetical protein EAZ08_06000 [Cytophagales bacterium]|nr:MAG: hypothetical protein EAZ08_06000 [Cytophagales bacterium]
MNQQRKTLKLFLLLIACFTVNITKAQKLPNLDSLKSAWEEYYAYDGWQVDKKSDSVLVFTRMRISKIGYRSIRRTTDSLNYKLFAVFRKEKSKTEEYNINFKAFIKAILKKDSIGIERPVNVYSYYWESFMSYTIPPMIITPEYSIVFFDNLREGQVIKPYDEANQINACLWDTIISFADGNIFSSYWRFEPIPIKAKYINQFGLFYWYPIAKHNYPELFE